jgi:MATE family multidrug resistance protein
MMKLALPSVISYVFAVLTEFINIIFVGHLGDSAMLAGVGMGNMIINIFGLSLLFGINGALDTLVS